MKTSVSLKSVALAAAFVFVLGASIVRAEDMAQKSLYERLGGEPAITAVVDDFVNRAAGDPAVNFTRAGSGGKTWDATPENVAMLKKHLTQFICSVTGGPQAYEGKDLAAAHAGMKITDDQFNAIAGDLAASLDKFNVPEAEKNELLAIAGTTRGSIVEAPAEEAAY
jgi:hemoglobin